MNLSDCTTLHLGGPARSVVEVTSEAEFVEAVRSADAAGEPVLIVSGGSNLVVSDEGFAGTVILNRYRGGSYEFDACSGAMVTVNAGDDWDAFVRMTLERGWTGVEALSGIPGLVGSTPIQNVGAYGQEVSQTIASVKTYDRHERAIRTFAAIDCDFSYRSSRFKAEADRYVVLSVTFQLKQGTLGAPVRYAELAKALEVELGERAHATAVRDAVLALRRSKGMVLDAEDHDTWSAGSFFTNPILSAEQAAHLPPDAPSYSQPDGSVKTSAAWLIDRAGFAKGYARGAASLSTKHTLALTNRGGATTADLLDLAREVRDGVRDRFGVTLVNEPVLVGVSL
ncbi:MAG: UDP-N-acetylmuramate dehydrogenase [Nocardioidaceae bacterium]|nr:UDP-N-acetylmuramate dehydrogenase [Nocardioidaceae bacterium]